MSSRNLPAVPGSGTEGLDLDDFYLYIKVMLSLSVDPTFLEKIGIGVGEDNEDNLAALNKVEGENKKLITYLREKRQLTDEIVEICLRFPTMNRVDWKIDQGGTRPPTYNCLQCANSVDELSVYSFESMDCCRVIALCQQHSEIVERFFLMMNLRSRVLKNCRQKIGMLRFLHPDEDDGRRVNRATDDHGWCKGMAQEFLSVWRKVEKVSPIRMTKKSLLGPWELRILGNAKNNTDNGEANDKGAGAEGVWMTGLDLDSGADIGLTSPDPRFYGMIYEAKHDAPCHVVSFRSDGGVLATASKDGAIRIMDVEKIIARGMRGIDIFNASDSGDPDPVIRTLYDNSKQKVTCLAFQPRKDKDLLLSGSDDGFIKMFDFSKTAIESEIEIIKDVAPIRALDFDPTGEYVLVGTMSANVLVGTMSDNLRPTMSQNVRRYNVETQQCFVISDAPDEHRGGITDIKYSNNGHLFVTGSVDGNVKVWDIISKRCVHTFKQPHGVAEICSVRFTKNAKYILTAGRDSIVKLWDLSTNRCQKTYTVAGATGAQELPIQASFNHNEDYVLLGDEKSGSLRLWESRNADQKGSLAFGHTEATRAFVHSPTQPAFVTGSDDHTARFWYKELLTTIKEEF